MSLRPGMNIPINQERGVYKTTNGGKTWQKIFYKDEKTGVIDLAMDPENPEILYASTAERLRYRWNDPKPTPQSGLYKTVDGGKTWLPLTKGLPDFSKGDCERIGIDICRTKPNVVYALIDRIIDKSRRSLPLSQRRQGGNLAAGRRQRQNPEHLSAATAGYSARCRVDPDESGYRLRHGP